MAHISLWDSRNISHLRVTSRMCLWVFAKIWMWHQHKRLILSQSTLTITYRKKAFLYQTSKYNVNFTRKFFGFQHLILFSKNFEWKRTKITTTFLSKNIQTCLLHILVHLCFKNTSCLLGLLQHPSLLSVTKRLKQTGKCLYKLKK